MMKARAFIIAIFTVATISMVAVSASQGQNGPPAYPGGGGPVSGGGGIAPGGPTAPEEVDEDPEGGSPDSPDSPDGSEPPTAPPASPEPPAAPPPVSPPAAPQPPAAPTQPGPVAPRPQPVPAPQPAAPPPAATPAVPPTPPPPLVVGGIRIILNGSPTIPAGFSFLVICWGNTYEYDPGGTTGCPVGSPVTACIRQPDNYTPAPNCHGGVVGPDGFEFDFVVSRIPDHMGYCVPVNGDWKFMELEKDQPSKDSRWVGAIPAFGGGAHCNWNELSQADKCDVLARHDPQNHAKQCQVPATASARPAVTSSPATTSRSKAAERPATSRSSRPQATRSRPAAKRTAQPARARSARPVRPAKPKAAKPKAKPKTAPAVAAPVAPKPSALSPDPQYRGWCVASGGVWQFSQEPVDGATPAFYTAGVGNHCDWNRLSKAEQQAYTCLFDPAHCPTAKNKRTRK